ncbi:MAG: tetratricopeptide repeat protein [Chloroflexota bacterium]|nr:tetratricopeptide repeat protein [Chloroflexota bacterium]
MAQSADRPPIAEASRSPATFRHLLRRLRLAAGLTQEALAERAGLSVRTLSDLERNDRVRPRPATVALLATALTLAGRDRAIFDAAARGETAVFLRPFVATSPPDNLPVPLTPLVGRERAVAAVTAFLRHDRVRLLTVTGPGGVGKTRLAIAAAAELRPAFADGCIFVSLASVHTPMQVLAIIAQTLAVRPLVGQTVEGALIAALREKQMLLVLDNFEQVLAVGPAIADLLQQCPSVKALITSRAALAVRGEQELPVAPLALPDTMTATDLAALGTVESVALFVQRAAAIAPDFVLTEANAPAIAAICIRLDGLPLAIELAAAQTRLFTPAALLARLTHRLDVLIDGATDLPDRHRTLRDAIAWSYALLSHETQRCFRWSALFVGGWTPERAAALCAPAGEGASVIPLLMALVRANLIRTEAGDDQTRFAMLETIRDYGLEQLAASGEVAGAQARYADIFLAWVAESDVTLAGPDQRRTVRALTREHDNIRAALRWAHEERVLAVGLPLAVALSRFWEMQGHLSEGRAWLEAFLALSHPGESPVTDLDRAKALNSAGIFAYRLGDYPHAAARLEESIAIFRALGETRRVAAALNNLGNVAKEQGEYHQAGLLHQESLALKREMGDRRGIAASLNNLGMIASARGDDEAAASLYAEAALLQRQGDDRWVLSHTLNNWGEVALRHGDSAGAVARFMESLALKREFGDWWGSVLTLNNLGRAAMLRGDTAEAAMRYRESLALCEATDDAVGLPDALVGLARVAALRSQPARAARLFGMADERRGILGGAITLTDDPERDPLAATARTALGAEIYEAAWQAGRSLTRAQAITEARAEE